ncbi:19545_t:CDS:2 [Funneliformis geosporum]|uniref:19545_t:CDS:1 n=1 Tax=Funneliformis geosporum TaxID=1117311 RepID=A0A9W4SMK8_9GLOM|nr:19545_t:CDS:2 [Funneliformis geosporum]
MESSSNYTQDEFHELEDNLKKLVLMHIITIENEERDRTETFPTGPILASYFGTKFHS